jgi:zinc protease
LIYGEDSPRGRFYSPDDYAKLEISDCKEFYEKFFTSGGGKVIVVGPVSSADVKAKLSFLETWKDKGIEMPKVELAKDINTTQIFGIQYTDAEQSDIIIGFRSLPFDYNGDYFKSNVMNFALGGNFNSRLNLNIREDKGWTYGIRGSFGREHEDLPGYYTIQTGVKSEATDSAINEILWTIEDYKQNGITDEEFEFTKSALVASQALDYQSLGQKASFMYQMQSRNLPLNFAEEQLKTIKNLTKEEINKLAKEQLKTDQMIIVVAGDMVLLEDRLSDLGFKKITILDKDGTGRVKYLKAGKTKHKKRR